MKPFVFSVLLALALAGCETPRSKFERLYPPQPTLEGKSTFFDQTLLVRASLSPPKLPDGPDGSSGAPGGAPPFMPPQGAPSDMSVGIGAGGGKPGAGMPGGGMPTGGPPAGLDPAAMRAPAGMAGFAPPRAVMRLSFENTSKQTIEIEITEVSCLLGNYAPRPRKLALAPGQLAELNPMYSTSTDTFEALDLRLRLRRGQETDAKILPLTTAKP